MMSDSGARDGVETRKRSRHSQADNGGPASPTRTVSTRPGRSCLLIVDVQNDFCTGSLKAPSALDIIPIINRVRASHEWDLVVFTGDAHPPNHVSFFVNHATNPAAQLFQPLQLPNGQEQVMWPVHCVKGTRGAELHADLAREPTDVIVEKGNVQDQEYYSAFTSTCGRHHTSLDALLRQHGITDVVACGLVHEYCVGNSAVDAAHAGYNTWLLTDATKGLTDEGVSKMNAKLDKAGVTRIESQELSERGFKPASCEDSNSHAQQQQQSSSPSSPHRALSWQRQDSTSSAMSCDYNLPSRAMSLSYPTPLNSLTPSHSFSGMSPHSFPAGSPSHSSYMLSRANSTLSNNGNGAPAADAAAAGGVAATAAAGAMATSSPGATATAAASSSASASALSSASAGPRPRVLLGLSGSVASIKAVELVQSLSQWAEVRVLCTARSLHFFSAHELESRLHAKVYQDEDEWRDAPWKRGDPVLHVELRRWADMLVIAPLSANTLAKISNGLCDNLLSTVVRCWSFTSNPLLVAPAMNTVMWESPFTARHLATLQELGAAVVQPVAKQLACGDVGQGAMASVDDIAHAARQAWLAKLQQGYQQQPPPPSLALTPQQLS